MDLVKLHKNALDFAREHVFNIKKDQWSMQSNCTEWTVRDLVNHIVSENWWVPELLGGKTPKEVGDTLEGDLLDGDPLHAFKDSSEAAQKAVEEMLDLSQKVHASWDDIPASEYIEQRIFDITVHGWDIAKSTGQEDIIDKDLLDYVYKIIEKNKQEFSQTGLFGTPLEVNQIDDQQTKLLALIGRKR